MKYYENEFWVMRDDFQGSLYLRVTNYDIYVWGKLFWSHSEVSKRQLTTAK